jgi:hypothetical protein
MHPYTVAHLACVSSFGGCRIVRDQSPHLNYKPKGDAKRQICRKGRLSRLYAFSQYMLIFQVLTNLVAPTLPNKSLSGYFSSLGRSAPYCDLTCLNSRSAQQPIGQELLRSLSELRFAKLLPRDKNGEKIKR